MPRASLGHDLRAPDVENQATASRVSSRPSSRPVDWRNEVRPMQSPDRSIAHRRYGVRNTDSNRGAVAVAYLSAVLLATVTYGLPLVVGGSFGSPMVIATLSVTVTLVCTALLVHANIEFYFAYWISLVAVQNAATGLWVPPGLESVPLIVTESKSVSIVFAGVICLPAIMRLRWSAKTVIYAWIVYCLWVVLSVRAIDMAMFAYARNFLLPLAIFIFVVAVTEKFDEEQRHRMAEKLAVLVFWFAAIGISLEALIGTERWRSLFNADRLDNLTSLSEMTRLFGFQLSRHGGFVMEPTTAGYMLGMVMAVAVVMLLRSDGRPKTMQGLIVLVGPVLLFLTGAKSAWLMVALLGLTIAVARLKLRPAVTIVTTATAAFVIVSLYLAVVHSPRAVIAAFSEPTSIVGGDSTGHHYGGLLAGIIEGTMRPIGYGLGEGGNFSHLAGTEGRLIFREKVATGGESAWGVLSYQTGIVGLLLLLVVVVLIGKRWGPDTLVLLVGWLVAAMYAETVFGVPTASYLMVGAALLRTETQDDASLTPLPLRKARSAPDRWHQSLVRR